MKKNKLVKLLLVPMVLVGMISPFAQQVSAEHIEIDTDNPMLSEKNNLVIEKDIVSEGYQVETNAGDRGELFVKEKTAPKLDYSTDYRILELIQSGISPTYLDGYGATAVILKDVQPTDTIKVSYNRVGTYQGRGVKASVTYSDIQNKKNDSSDYDESAFDFSENMYSGYVFFNVESFEQKYQFYFIDTNEPVDFLGDSFFTFNSLNTGEFVAYEDTEANVYTMKDSVVKYLPNPSPTSHVTDVWMGTSEDFTDYIGGATFRKATVSFKVSGETQSFLVGSKENSAWNALSSATLFDILPDIPTKSVRNEDGEDIDGGKVEPGQVIEYQIAQKVNTLGVDLLEKYQSMVFVDKLPEEVTFIEAELQDDTGNKVDENGTAEFDDASHTLTYTVSSEFLQNEGGIRYEGETYILSVQVKVNEDVTDGVVLRNIANVLINGSSQDSNEVTVIPEVLVIPTPEDPKPEVVTPEEKLEVEESIDLPAAGGMEMSKAPLLAFLAGIGTMAGGGVYFLKKRG